MSSVRLTPDQVDELVAMKLRGSTNAEVSRKVGTSETTVKARWQKYLRESAAERAKHVETVRESVVGRLERISKDLANSALRALVDDDLKTAQDAWDKEAKVLKEIGRLQGLDKIEIDAQVRVHQEQAEGLFELVRVALAAVPGLSDEQRLAIVQALAETARAQAA